MASTASQHALYRSLRRAAKLAFGRDETAVQAAFARIRSDFAKPVSGEEELHKRMADGRGVVSVLRHNVIQGQLNDKGSYALRMHSEIEMGDNETIKLGRNRTSELLASTKATKKCGG